MIDSVNYKSTRFVSRGIPSSSSYSRASFCCLRIEVKKGTFGSVRKYIHIFLSKKRIQMCF